MEFTWVIARYLPNTPQGKNALAHADAGIGYVLMNPTRGKGEDIMVAFKFPLVKPIPRHLSEATPYQIAYIEKKSR